jgi:DNA polymerase-3 subunit epsilon
MGDAILVAHNAGFDRNFLNMELEKCGRAPIPDDRWIDTAMMARKKYPGAPANLDALCRRFEISLESRTFHGALLDSQLLASVYLELLGGRAHAFTFESEEELSRSERKRSARQRAEPLQSFILEEERAAHAAFVDSLGDDAIWKKVG